MQGVVYVDNRYQKGIFTQADLELLESIASSAGIAIENARLYQVAVDKGRMERELQVAREVQASLIPPYVPQLKGWEFAACWKPAHEVSGDFYDFITLPQGRTGLVVADVSDKGMPAAIFMALSRSIIRAVVGRNDRSSSGYDAGKPPDMAGHSCRKCSLHSFMHNWIPIDSQELTYVNAGHNPPLFLKGNGSPMEGIDQDWHGCRC